MAATLEDAARSLDPSPAWHTTPMPKTSKSKKRPPEVNPLVEYLVDESVREGGVPDPPTQAQISLLMAETAQKGRKAAASKAAKAGRKKRKKPQKSR